jgi:hypothetical protein
VFDEGAYQPRTPGVAALLAHELAHVIQQSSDRSGARTVAAETSRDQLEHDANGAAARVIGGVSGRPNLSVGGSFIQCQTAGEATAPAPEKKDVGEVIAEGFKTVAEQATDENPQVRKGIVNPVKHRFKTQWNRLGTGEKVGSIGVGAATMGMAGGALLSDPQGRKQFEGVNLAAPFTLIPSMPLTSFKYTLPSEGVPDKRLFRFDIGFKADDLINLRTAARGLPPMSLSVNLQWGYDPVSERLSIRGGDATLGLTPGLSLSAGAYKDVLRPPRTLTDHGGRTIESKQSIPEAPGAKPLPDVRIMLNVDLMKFKPGELARQIKGIF